MRLPRSARDDQGFTLIELLVVILIIGILAVIAIPAFLSQTGKANDSAAKTQVGTLQTTIQAYATEHGS
jgi:type IV pilus assembly protein PilA